MGVINIHTFIHMVNIPLSLIVLIGAYCFNSYYLKKRHNLAIQAEGRSSLNLISLRVLSITVTVLVFALIPVLLIQKYSTKENLAGGVNILASVCLTVLIGSFALKPRVRGYALHRINQKLMVFRDMKVRRPEVWVKHRPRVAITNDM